MMKTILALAAVISIGATPIAYAQTGMSNGMQGGGMSSDNGMQNGSMMKKKSSMKHKKSMMMKKHTMMKSNGGM